MSSCFHRITWVALFAFVWTCGLARAQQTTPAALPNRITAQVSDAQRTPLQGSVSPMLKVSTDLGVLPGNQAMNRMVLVLKPSDAQQQDLDALVAQQHSPDSSQFHKWLTPAQFHARFGVSSADQAQVAAWLESRGFTAIKANAQQIEFSGTVSTVESAFKTSMHQYQTRVNGALETHVANATEISIPSALAPVVSGVLSLNNFHSRPAHTNLGQVKRNAAGQWARVRSDATSTDGNGDFTFTLAPGDIRNIYGAAPLPASVDGTGVSVTVLGRSNVELTDLQTFRKIFGLPAKDPNIILSGPDPGMPSYGDAGESTLDLEWVASVATNIDVNFVTAASTDTTDGIALAAGYAVENVTSPIITVSYGACEQHFGPSGNLFWKLMWEQAAAEGISVFVSSGDGGAAQCDSDNYTSPAVMGDTVSGLASTPFNTAVGGTQFAEGANPLQYWNTNTASNYTSAYGYIPEEIWNESCDPTLPVQDQNCAFGQSYYQATGGGGGRSNCAEGTVDDSGNVTCTAGYPKPSWQTGAGVPSDGVRDVPDIAFSAGFAVDPYMFCFVGGCQYTVSDSGQYLLTASNVAGGTSISTPVMAGFMALVEQQNGTFQGLINPVLYKLAAQQDASCSSTARTDPTNAPACIFNDLTAGSNSVPGLSGYGTSTADFTAAAGYDLASGLGSINVANLVNGWSAGLATTPTTTTLAASATTAKHGTPINLQVGVTAASGTPTGDFVLMSDKYGAGDQYTLGSNAAWSGAVSDLPGGSYTLTARYAGDGSFASSTSPGLAVTIAPEDSVGSMVAGTYDYSTQRITPVTSVPYYGYTLYFKGVIAASSGHGVPTGTVSVMMDGTTNLGDVALTADGGFLVGTMDVPVGNHTFAARYAGDNSFNTSLSPAVSVSVPKGQAVTFPSSIGGPDNLLAVVVTTSGNAKPTGTVQVFDNGTAISGVLPVVYTGPLGDGTAQAFFSHQPFASGKHVITATYSGDSNYLAVALGSDFAYSITLNVGQNTGTTPTITTFKMNTATTLQMGQIASFNYAVAPATANAQVPTGIVYLYDGNGGVLTGGNIANGQGSAIFYADSAGTFTIRAGYQGDNTFAPSYSAGTVTLTVPKLTPVTTFNASAAYVATGAQMTLNFTATGVMINPWVEQDPQGTVTFTDSANGGPATPLGTFSLNFINGKTGGYSGRFALANGTHTLTATYSGNANFNSTTSVATVVVTPPDFVLSGDDTGLTLPAGASAAATLTLTPVLGYTGATTLACTGAPAGATCTLSPNSVNLTGEQNVTVTLTMPAASPSASSQQASNPAIRMLGGLSLAGLALFFLPRRWKQARVWLALLLFIVPIGCGGSGTPRATLLAIASSNTKAASGAPVTLTATLDALTSNATGTVTFYDGAASLGSAPVAQGTASLKTSSLSVGAHSISAVYSGDNHNEKSTSITITQIITGTASMQVTATSGSVSHAVSLPVTVQ